MREQKLGLKSLKLGFEQVALCPDILGSGVCPIFHGTKPPSNLCGTPARGTLALSNTICPSIGHADDDRAAADMLHQKSATCVTLT